MPLHAPEGALEHIAHLAGPKVPEPFPGELAVLLAPGAIEGDPVEVPPVAGPDGKMQRPQVVPGSFKVVVYER